MQKLSEETITKMSEADQRIIEANVGRFNKTVALRDHLHGNVRMKILRNLLNSPALKNIFIFCLTGYVPINRFNDEENCSHWFLRTAVDGSDNNKAYAVIEERRDGIWQLRHLIPIEAISNLKTELGPADKTTFNIFLTIPGVEKIPTPPKIPFYAPRNQR